MNVTRVAVVLFALAGVGLSLVQLRGQRTQHVHQMQQFRVRQSRGQHALWALQLETARLGAPARIRERAAHLGLVVVPQPRPKARRVAVR